jgi:hypothetical protein
MTIRNIAVVWGDFEGASMPSGLSSPFGPALKGLKTRSNRIETQRLESQPRQSGDWRSQEGVFFLGDDLQNLAKNLP